MRRMSVLVMATVVVLLGSPAANADPFSAADGEYLQELNAYGLNPANLHMSNLAAEITLGHSVCNDLAKGRSPNDLVSSVGQSLPNLSLDQRQGLITVAVVNYCPNVLPRPLPWSPQG